MRARDRSENDEQNAAREFPNCGKARIIRMDKIKASDIFEPDSPLGRNAFAGAIRVGVIDGSHYRKC